MARPPKYTSDEAKPIGLSLRLPRDLYDQVQHHAKMRQTTLTQLVIEGLQMRLETPTDPRDILASQDTTVIQELRQMIADEVQAALAVQHFQAPDSTPARQTENNGKTQHYGNATQEQTYAPEPQHSMLTEPVRARPALGQYKLTPRQVASLRKKRQRGTPIKALMEEYGISKATLFRYLQKS